MLLFCDYEASWPRNFYLQRRGTQFETIDTEVTESQYSSSTWSVVIKYPDSVPPKKIFQTFVRQYQKLIVDSK